MPVTTTGRITRQPTRAMTASEATSGHLVRQPRKTIKHDGGAVTTTGRITRQPRTVLTKTVKAGHALSNYPVMLAAHPITVARLVMRTSRSLTVTQGHLQLLRRQPRPVLKATPHSAGSFTSIKARFVNLAKTVTVTPAMTRARVFNLTVSTLALSIPPLMQGMTAAGRVTMLRVRQLAASEATGVRLVRKTARTFAKQEATSASALRSYRFNRTYLASSHATSALIRTAKPVLHATKTAGGTLSRYASRRFTVTTTAVPMLQRALMNLRFIQTIHATGSIQTARLAILRTYAASTATTASITRRVSAIIALTTQAFSDVTVQANMAIGRTVQAAPSLAKMRLAHLNTLTGHAAATAELAINLIHGAFSGVETWRTHRHGDQGRHHHRLNSDGRLGTDGETGRTDARR